MSTATRVPLAEAEAVAHSLVADLADASERIEIGGSIRRQKPDVGDIEIVAVPRTETVADGMFDTREVDLLQGRVDDLLAVGVLASHPDDPKRGARYSKLLHAASGLQLDLFSPAAERFGIILLIRTGPSDYSERFVTDIRRTGHHVTGGELHRGGKFGCPRYCEVIPTPEERDVYAAVGRTYLEPRDRR